MTTPGTRYPNRIWLVIADTRNPAGPGDPAAWDPTSDWESAIDKYAEGGARGWECWVLGLDLATDTICDRTAEAHADLRLRLRLRGDEMPAWMGEAA